MSGKAGQKSAKATEVAERYTGGFMDELDGRVRLARTLHQRLRELTNDLGGMTNLSYQEQSLCKRLVHLERLIERKESTLAHGGTLDENYYYAALNALSGLFSKVGLKRRPKVLSLTDYLTNGTAAKVTNEGAEP